MSRNAPTMHSGADITPLQRFEETAHMRCCECGRFVPKDDRVPLLAEQRKNPNANIVRPVCARCREEADPPEW